MGQEIVYCYKCQKRIMGAEFARGQAYQLGNNVCCSTCAAELLQTLGPREREQLLAKMFKATQERQSASGTALPALPSGTPPATRALSSSSTRVKASKDTDRRKTTTSHIPVVHPRPAASPTSPSLLTGIIVAVVAGFVAILFFALSGGSSSAPEPSPVPKVSRPVSSPSPAPSTESPEQSRRREEARKVVQKARDLAAISPQDVLGQIRLWEQAQVAAENTPYAEEVRRELSRLVGRRKEIVSKDLGDLETQVQARLRAEEFKVAIDFFLAARGKHDAAEWSEAIDRRVNELRDRAAQLFASLKDSAVAAQKRRAAPDVQQIRDRILKWGLAEYSSDLQASLAGVAPDPEPVRGPVESALVGSWPLDEGSGTAAADVSGKAGKATLKGATWTTGRAGPAVLLDGSGAHVELPNSPEIDNLQEESYTIAVWFRPDSVPTDPKEPGFGGLAAVLLKPPFREGIVYTHAGKFILIHYLAGAKWTSTGTWSDTFAPGAWYHVAAVVDRPAGMLSIYVNGQVRGKEQIEKGAAAEQYHQEKWTAGKVKHHVDPGYCTKGALCDLRLYQRALDAKEVEALVSSKARSAGDGRAWKRIVDGQSLDGLNGKGFGGWKTESGAVVKDLQVDQAAQTREIIGDGEVRVCFEVKNCTILWFCLRQNGQDGYRVALGAQELQTLAAGPHELVFVAKGDAVTATFDGKPRAVDDSRKSQKGRLHFNASLGADFRISSIDIRPLH